MTILADLEACLNLFRGSFLTGQEISVACRIPASQYAIAPSFDYNEQSFGYTVVLDYLSST